MIAKSDSAVRWNKDQVSFEISESLFPCFMADLPKYPMLFFTIQPKLKYVLNYEFKSKSKSKCNSLNIAQYEKSRSNKMPLQS